MAENKYELAESIIAQERIALAPQRWNKVAERHEDLTSSGRRDAIRSLDLVSALIEQAKWAESLITTKPTE
jgi:hypothetical protein